MQKLNLVSLSLVAFVAVQPAAFCVSSSNDFDGMAKSARSTLEAMIEVNTTNPPGNEKRIVELVAARLKDAEIPYAISDFAPGRQNIVARLKGTGSSLKPIMLLSHIDVVGAEGQAWASDPHKLVEKDGMLYGRGTYDMLGMAAVNLEVFLALKRSGAALKRDVILALTGDEESGGEGIQYLLKHEPESINAAFVLNEGGQPVLGSDGKVQFVRIQGAEKIYRDFTILTKGTTGHSSIPQPDNAIFRLARALERIGRHKFPARLLPLTRGYFAARAALEPPRTANAMRALAKYKGTLPSAAVKVIDDNPVLAPNLRTTCVATVIKGGTRVNSLPAEASATVNCRILPDESPDEILQTLISVIADPKVEVRPQADFHQAPASDLTGPDIEATRAVIAEQWPGVPIIPYMMFGATDSRFLRQHGIPAFGLSPISISDDDTHRAHGIDERIPAASLRSGVEFFSMLIAKLASLP